MKKFAEEFNYWNTTVHPSKSQGEIIAMLEEFGIQNTQVSAGISEGKHAWLIRFHWDGKPYRFLFIPLECKYPSKRMSFGGKIRSAEEQSRYQMGRIAVYFIKAVLTAAECQPAALFGFMELNAKNKNGLPITAAEIDFNLLQLPETIERIG